MEQVLFQCQCAAYSHVRELETRLQAGAISVFMQASSSVRPSSKLEIPPAWPPHHVACDTRTGAKKFVMIRFVR